MWEIHREINPWLPGKALCPLSYLSSSTVPHCLPVPAATERTVTVVCLSLTNLTACGGRGAAYCPATAALPQRRLGLRSSRISPPLLFCFVLCCAALLHCTALHCTALHCTALHCTALHSTPLHCDCWTPAPHYTKLPCSDCEE